jgi:hypothetical protein
MAEEQNQSPTPEPTPPAPLTGPDPAKLQAEIQRLEKALAKRDAEQKSRETKDAEARGEHERLYGEAKARVETLAAELESARGESAKFAEWISARNTAAVKAVEDEKVRKIWAQAIDGLDPLKASDVLDALRAASAPPPQAPTTRPGPAGKGNRKPETFDAFSASDRQDAVRAALARVMAGGSE